MSSTRTDSVPGAAWLPTVLLSSSAMGVATRYIHLKWNCRSPNPKHPHPEASQGGVREAAVKFNGAIHSRYEPEYLCTMFRIFVVEFEKEDKQGKHDCQSRDANDGQPAQNLRQNIGQRIEHRHRREATKTL